MHIYKKARLAWFALGAALIAFGAVGYSPGVSFAAVSNWQKGVTFYPNSQTDYGSSAFQQVVAHLKSLGVDYVTLSIPYYQSNVSSTDMSPGWNTPSDAALISGIEYAHSLGMHVMLKLELDSNDGQWRAYINPSDRATWYANYSGLLQYYGKMAQAQGVEEFCIGAELIDMASAAQNSGNTGAWENMIAKLHGVYSGLLTYSANWGGSSFADEVDGIQFWNDLDSIGISAYYNLPGDGSVSSLESDWNSINASIIEPLSKKWNKPVLFTELGYRSVSGAHDDPWNSGAGGSYDAMEQENDYQALFAFWNNEPFMEGVQLWDVYADMSAGGAGNTDYTPQNKPVEQVMKQWFTAGAPPAAAAVSASGSASPSSASPGSLVSLTGIVDSAGGALSNANVDFEVYDGNARVFQKIWGGQNFAAGASRSFSASWTPASSGSYVFKIGVFSSDWSALYTWNNSAADIAVSGGASNSAVIDNWWPVNGAHISGTQPFKGLIEGLPLSAYDMYWQTGNGQRNLMPDSPEGYPHKEALVNLSGWTWEGDGPYSITFTATDKSGNVIAAKSFQIYTP